ncbi:MAG: CarD family transcriptional regulator, partial [Vampirovibrionia bacterium]
IPDNEFLTQELIQQDHHSHSHKIPDDEFFTETMLQQQQPQYHHQQHSHQIPDEEFFTEDLIQPQHAPQQMQQQRQMQQPQQRPQPQQQMQPHPQHHSHQIPDDEFFPTHQVQEHVQQNIQPKQFHQQIRPESIPDQVEDIPVYASAHLDNPINFKEGDKVRHERYGIGVINRIIPTGDKHLYSIQFQDYGRRLLDPNRGLVKVD